MGREPDWAWLEARLRERFAGAPLSAARSELQQGREFKEYVGIVILEEMDTAELNVRFLNWCVKRAEIWNPGIKEPRGPATTA